MYICSLPDDAWRQHLVNSTCCIEASFGHHHINKMTIYPPNNRIKYFFNKREYSWHFLVDLMTAFNLVLEVDVVIIEIVHLKTTYPL